MTEHIRINAVAPRIQYIADGTQAAFPFPFAIFQPADLEITVGDTPQAGGFSVTGAGDSGGGMVLFTQPPPAGARITLRRRLALQRTTDFQADGIIRAKTLNDELDYQTAALQQLDEEMARTVRRGPASPSTADLTLPEPAPGRGLKWNASGTGLVNSDFDPDRTGNAEAAAEAAMAARAAAEAARDQAQAAAGGVRVSADDPVAAPLASKLVAGPGLTLAEEEGPSGRRLVIAGGAGPDVQARLSFLELNLAVNTLRDQIDTGWSVLRMVDGWADEFEDEAGISVPPAVPAGAGTQSGVSSSPSYGAGGQAAWFDGSRSQAPGVSGTGNLSLNIGKDWGAGTTREVCAAAIWNPIDAASLGWSSAATSVTISLQGSADNNTWTTLASTSVAFNSLADVMLHATVLGHYRYHRVRLVEVGGSGSSHALMAAEVVFYEVAPGASSGHLYDPTGDYYAPVGSGDMTLVSATVLAAQATPAEARLVLLHQQINATMLNADCTIEASRDGGVTWTAGTLADEGAFDATTRILSAIVDLSGQPAGTAMRWRFRTFNGKSQRLHGVWFQWR